MYDPSGTEIPRGWGGGSNRKNHLLGGGGCMDIFWNHTICIRRVTKISLIRNRHTTSTCNLTRAIFLPWIFADFRTGLN